MDIKSKSKPKGPIFEIIEIPPRKKERKKSDSKKTKEKKDGKENQ